MEGPVQRVISFSAGPGSLDVERKSCLNITAVQDDIYEDVKSFNVTISSLNSSEDPTAVLIIPATTEVFVLDTDGTITLNIIMV